MSNLPYYMLCLWTFIHIGRPQDIFTFLVPFHIGDIVAFVTIVSYYLTGQRHPEIRFYPEVTLFLLFIGIAAISTPIGYYPGKSLEFLFGFGIKLGIYLWLVAKLITTEDRIQGILKSLIFSGFAMAISALSRAAAGGRIGGGSTYDPNDLALILVTTLPIAIMLGLSSSSFRWKIICFGGAVFNLIGIIATQSRGGFLGLVALGVFMLFVKLPGISKKKFILILSILAMIFGTYLGTEYRERIQTIFEETTSDITAGSGRIAVWKRSLQIARDNPFLGVGPNAYETAYGNYIENDKFAAELSPEAVGTMWKTAHNSFLLVLTEMGLPGLVIFLAINVKTFRNSQRVKSGLLKYSPKHVLSIQATTLQMALFGFLTCAFFLSQSYNILMYLYLFLSGAIVRQASLTEREGNV